MAPGRRVDGPVPRQVLEFTSLEVEGKSLGLERTNQIIDYGIRVLRLGFQG